MREDLLTSWRQFGQKQDPCPSLLNHNAKYKRLLPPYCDFANRWTARARTIMGRKWGACVGCGRGTLHLAWGWPLGGRKTLGEPIPPNRSVRAVSRHHSLFPPISASTRSSL